MLSVFLVAFIPVAFNASQLDRCLSSEMEIYKVTTCAHRTGLLRSYEGTSVSCTNCGTVTELPSQKQLLNNCFFDALINDSTSEARDRYIHTFRARCPKRDDSFEVFDECSDRRTVIDEF